MWNARAHEAKRICLGVKQTFTNGGECKGWSPMTSKCTPTVGVALVRESRMFIVLVGKAKKIKLGPQDTIKKVLKHKCLKCPRVVHLDMICMRYDQKKGRESNWEFDLRPQTP